jgi:protein TIF31
VEFTESCKTAVVAIVDGHIAPMNPQDSERAHVYIYNNIFFSRANDANDTLRMFYGDDASRKSVGKDLAHQRLIQSVSWIG